MYTMHTMSISTISVRIPELVKKELKEFEREEKLIQTSEATRKLLLIGLETWRRERALDLLSQSKISFSKAAQMAKMNVWDFTSLIKERKIVWIKDAALIEKDINAIQ